MLHGGLVAEEKLSKLAFEYLKDCAREDENNLFSVPDMLKEFEGHEKRCVKSFLSDSYWLQWKNLALFINYSTFEIEDVDFECTLGPRESRPSMLLTEGYSEDDPDYEAVYTGEWVAAPQVATTVKHQPEPESDSESQEESPSKVKEVVAQAQEVR